ncbi:MAG: hypothetical protein LBI31_03050 [Zoogloeaceae bacterium]|jgi:hypothetical protein|nr:hypothetical protein [Zoogloeaceae bacterium]
MWDFERYFLFVEPEAARLYRWQKGALARVADFAPDAAGLAGFAQWRAREARLPVTVLTDLPDEGFVVESIPRLSGAERRAVIRRKTRQHFPDTPYVAAQALPLEGRGSEKGRREEILLLSSLPAVPLQDWIDRAKPLSGLYALAQLFPAAAKRLGLPDDAILLTRRGDFVRQTWLRARVPCFSRLVRASDNAETLRAETRRLLTYLARQSTLALKADVPLCPLFKLSERERESLGAEFTLTPNPAVEADAAFFLSLLAESPPRTQYAPEDLRQSSPELKRFTLAAGALCLAAGMAFGAYACKEAAFLRHETEEVLREEKEEEARLATSLAAPQAADGEWSFDEERAARLLADFPERMPQTLPTDLQTLSRLLDAFPALRLESLVWEAAGQRMVLELRVETAIETADESARLKAGFLRAARTRGFREASAGSGDDEADGLIRLVLAKGQE